MKFSIALNVILFGVLSMLFLKQCWPPKKPKFNCKDACTQHFLSGLAGAGEPAMISYATAKRMSESYYLDKGKAYINGDPSNPDALSITFPMDQLKSFVWSVEQMVCAGNCSGMDLGVKVYYGKYPKETGLSDAAWDIRTLPRNYANRHSLFFVPVIRSNPNELWTVFDPTEPPENCHFPSEVPADTSKRYAFTFFNSPTGPTDANNHGGLRPPPFEESPLTFPR